MRFRVLGAAVAVVAGLGLTASSGAVAVDNEALTRDLDTILADAALKNADVGVVVRDANTGEVIYTRQSARRSQVASNLKLLTTTAALEKLGEEFRWKTELLTTGTRDGSTLNGDVVLRGTGDPTMSALRYKALADQLKASGITKVTGALVIDDTAFDSQPYGTGWAWDDESEYYSAEISALTLAPDANYSAGTVIVRVKPGAAGAPTTVTVEPDNYAVGIVNTSTSGGDGIKLGIERDHGTNVVRVTGSTNAEYAELTTVKDPSGLVTSVFRQALERNGIFPQSGVRKAAAPAGATVLGTELSLPLKDLMKPLLKESNNMMAEALVKTAGVSFTNGINQLSAKWRGLGVDPNDVEIVEGSGMSRLNEMSPDQITNLLIAAKSKPWFAKWQESLPVAGVDGTLRNRMTAAPAKGNVKAKTGSLTGVSALSGYVTTADNRQLVFSIVTNNGYHLVSVRPIEDRIATRLAQDVKGQAVTQIQSVPQQRQTPAQERTDVECSWINAC